MPVRACTSRFPPLTLPSLEFTFILPGTRTVSPPPYRDSAIPQLPTTPTISHGSRILFPDANLLSESYCLSDYPSVHPFIYLCIKIS